MTFRGVADPHHCHLTSYTSTCEDQLITYDFPEGHQRLKCSGDDDMNPFSNDKWLLQLNNFVDH